jgi:hypothetical protein
LLDVERQRVLARFEADATGCAGRMFEREEWITEIAFQLRLGTLTAWITGNREITPA